MKRLIYILPIVVFLTGCIYINRDVGLTNYMYDKCEEYYDAEGTYHKDCPDSLVKKGEDLAKDTFVVIRESYKKVVDSLSSENSSKGNSKNSKQSRGRVVKTTKRCVCSKSCFKRCIKTLSKPQCLKRCCHEK